MKIVYAIAADFPHGTPYASRTLNFCRILRTLGHQVVVFCDYLSDKDMKVAGIAQYEGIDIFYSFEERTILSKLSAMFVTPFKLGEYLKSNNVNLVIASQTSNRFERILRTCRHNNVKIVVELCEKFHYSNWRFGKYDIQHYQFLHCWNKLYKKADGFITISTYIYNIFKSYEKPIVRIPTIIDTDEHETIYLNRKKAEINNSFIFTGGLGGGKDRLCEWIVANDKDDSRNNTTNIFGPTLESVLEQLHKFGKEYYIPDNVHIKGRIPQKDVPIEISKNDFGLILRPDRESSHAGFPTKIAEYLSVGTAVVANRTSDIPLYIADGYNGFLVADLSLSEIQRIIDQINSMTLEEKTAMQINARKTAIKSFDYHNYVDLLEVFLNSVCN